MDKVVKSPVYVLGDDIDTDQIIPARHLALSLSDPRERARYGALALSGVPAAMAGLPEGNVPFVEAGTNLARYAVVIAGRNFGCGSSREHAPVALREAGVRVVVARSFARIFYRNAVDGGYFPPVECREDLSWVRTGETVVVDLSAARITRESDGRTCVLDGLGAAEEIVFAGGLFAYARAKNIIQTKRDP